MSDPPMSIHGWQVLVGAENGECRYMKSTADTATPSFPMQQIGALSTKFETTLITASSES
jgi:hypothetical protein